MLQAKAEMNTLVLTQIQETQTDWNKYSNPVLFIETFTHCSNAYLFIQCGHKHVNLYLMTSRKQNITKIKSRTLSSHEPYFIFISFLHFIFSVPEPAPSEPKDPDSPKGMPLDLVTEPVHTDSYSYMKRENKPKCPIPLRPEQSVTASQPYYISGKCQNSLGMYTQEGRLLTSPYLIFDQTSCFGLFFFLAMLVTKKVFMLHLGHAGTRLG